MKKTDKLKTSTGANHHRYERRADIETTTSIITLISLVASLGTLLIIRVPNAIATRSFSTIDSLLLLLFITLLTKSMGLFCYNKKKIDLFLSIISIVAIIFCLLSMYVN